MTDPGSIFGPLVLRAMVQALRPVTALWARTPVTTAQAVAARNGRRKSASDRTLRPRAVDERNISGLSTRSSTGMKVNITAQRTSRVGRPDRTTGWTLTTVRSNECRDDHAPQRAASSLAPQPASVPPRETALPHGRTACRQPLGGRIHQESSCAPSTNRPARPGQIGIREAGGFGLGGFNTPASSASGEFRCRRSEPSGRTLRPNPPAEPAGRTAVPKLPAACSTFSESVRVPQQGTAPSARLRRQPPPRQSRHR